MQAFSARERILEKNATSRDIAIYNLGAYFLISDAYAAFYILTNNKTYGRIYSGLKWIAIGYK